MRRPARSAPPRGTDRRFHVGRAPRSCVNATRLRASRRGPGWRAARRWRRRPPPTPARPPTSAPSGRLRLPPPHVPPYATLIPVGSGFGRRFCSTTRVLPQGPGALYTEIGREFVLFFPLSAADGQVPLRS